MPNVRVLAVSLMISLPLALLAVAAPTAQAASDGCTVVYPARNCMYSCIQGETQWVKVTGNDVTGRADCGYGYAQCHVGAIGTTCSRWGTSATFSDTYWNACSVDPGALAAFWVVECTSG